MRSTILNMKRADRNVDRISYRVKKVLSEDVILKSGKKLLFNDEKTRNVSYSNIQDKKCLASRTVYSTN